MLEALTAQDLALYAASNGPEAQQKHRLAISGLAVYFKDSSISEAAGASKPERAFFDYAFSKINASRHERVYPQEAVIIGDSLTFNRASGRVYGVKSCCDQRASALLAGGAWGIPVKSAGKVKARGCKSLYRLRSIVYNKHE